MPPRLANVGLSGPTTVDRTSCQERKPSGNGTAGMDWRAVVDAATTSVTASPAMAWMTQVVFMTADSSGAAPAGQPPFDEPPDGIAERVLRWHERSRPGIGARPCGAAGIDGARAFVNRTRPLVK